MDAAGVVALGRLALHTGDGRQVRQTSEIAKAMLNESTPVVRRHPAWLLSLQAKADGDPQRQAHRWLCVMAGELERRACAAPVLWMDMADEPLIVRMALAVGDRELAETAAADAGRRAELCPGVPSLDAIAAHASGLLDGDTDKLSEAVSLFERSPRALAHAAAWEDLGLASSSGKERQILGDRRPHRSSGPFCARRGDHGCGQTPRPPAKRLGFAAGW